MTNRFSKSPIKYRFLSFAGFSVLLFLFFFVWIWHAINSVSESSIQKQQESLETAIMRDISQCYSVEGSYPPSLSYLEEHYALTYNKDLFFVDYRPIGANMLPDVTIIRLGGAGHDK